MRLASGAVRAWILLMHRGLAAGRRWLRRHSPVSREAASNRQDQGGDSQRQPEYPATEDLPVLICHGWVLSSLRSHAGLVLELERDRVDAVAVPGGLGTIREDVAQVGATAVTDDLGPHHAKAGVPFGRDVFFEMGAQKLGQPEPESYLVSELNSSLPQATHL